MWPLKESSKLSGRGDNRSYARQPEDLPERSRAPGHWSEGPLVVRGAVFILRAFGVLGVWGSWVMFVLLLLYFQKQEDQPFRNRSLFCVCFPNASSFCKPAFCCLRLLLFSATLKQMLTGTEYVCFCGHPPAHETYVGSMWKDHTLPAMR